MENTVVDNPTDERFEIRVDGQVAGYAAYERSDKQIAFTHTKIEDEYEGKGLASVLVRRALDAAREEGRGVLPYCPFVKGWIQKHPEYTDLVPGELLSRFGLAEG